MADQRWIVPLEDGAYTVDLSPKGRNLRLMINGAQQPGFKKGALDVGGDYPFQLGRHQAMLHSRTNGFKSSYDLSIDGISVSTRQPVTPLGPVPPWAWVFVVICGLIPVISLGGGLPIVLGVGGAMSCYMQARRSDVAVGTRIGWCVGITVLCWALFSGLLFAVSQMR